MLPAKVLINANTPLAPNSNIAPTIYITAVFFISAFASGDAVINLIPTNISIITAAANAIIWITYITPPAIFCISPDPFGSDASRH